jgi:hypothetical protein
VYDFGENIFMNNEKYLDELDGRLQVLNELRKRIIELSKAIIGDTLYKEDFFFTSAMDRSVVLLDGISEMIKNRNLACGGILLRSQIDNCMRIFAAFIAESQTDFIDGFFVGKKISDMKDNRGNKMKDYILRQRLAEYDAKLDLVYRNFSEYVHLAEKAFYSSVTTSSSEQYDIEFSVGLPLKEKANPVLLEVADAFVYYVKLQNNLVNQIVISKAGW